MDVMPARSRLTLRNFKIGLMDALMLPPNAVVQASMPPQLQLAAIVNAKGPGEDRPDNGDMDEGSPPLPGLQIPAGPSILDTETRRLIGRFLSDFTGLSTAAWSQGKAQSTMQRVVTKLVDKHRIRFNGIINKLSLDRRGRDMSFVSQVARNQFANGTTNWGGIASLLAFCAVVSQALKEKQQASCVELVAQEVSTYLLSHQRTWLVQHNAWDGFAEFFKEEDLESTVRNLLLSLVGLVSITAAMLQLFR